MIRKIELGQEISIFDTLGRARTDRRYLERLREEFRGAFPNFNLEDEVFFDGKGNVTTLKDNETGRFGRGAIEKIMSSKYPVSKFVMREGSTNRND